MTLRPLLDQVADAITVRQLETPMAEAFTVDVRDRESQVAVRLQARDFDHAPVKDGARVVGFVRKADLHERSREAVEMRMRPLGDETLISADASITTLLPWVASHPFLFVLDGHVLTGLVTPSDLNKQAGRTYFYLLVAGFELGLAERARADSRPQAVLIGKLPSERRQLVRRRFDARRRRDVEADLVSCLDFSDLLTLLILDRPFARSTIIPSFALADLDAAGLAQLRNKVMHGTTPLLGRQEDLQRLIDQDSELRRYLNYMSSTLVEETAVRDGLARFTPEELAADMGLRNAKSLRAYLRRKHPRPASALGTLWSKLPRALERDVRQNFRPRQQHR
jgi:hypothetical protein